MILEQLWKSKQVTDLNQTISIREFSVNNIRPKDRKHFYEYGRYANNYAEVYLQIALHINGISDKNNMICLRELVALGKNGLKLLKYNDTDTVSDNSILLAELILKQHYGIILT